MQEIEFSVMSGGSELNELQSLLRPFEAEHQARVIIRPLTWETGWAELLKFTFNNQGPAVSEIGDTWVASLALMNALRPFSEREVAAFGGREAFLRASWRSTSLPNDDTIWTIPWFAETRAIYYRRDLLRAVGVSEATAFATRAALQKTLQRLQEGVKEIPWVVPTGPSVDTLHNLTSWIWGAGGEYEDPVRRQVAFDQEPARAGIRDYYSLHRFLTPEAHGLEVTEADALFAQGRAAVTMSGPWLALSPSVQRAPGLMAQVGITPPPGVPAVLGSHLVIWDYVTPHQERLALELVRFLTERPAQFTWSQQVGMLPVKTEVLANPPFSTDPFYQALVRGLQSGRSFPVMRLWGLIEEQLTAAFGRLWSKVLAEPDPNLDGLIRAELEPLAERLNRRLQ